MLPFNEYTLRLRAREAAATLLERLQNRIGTLRLSLGVAIAIAAGFSLLSQSFSPWWLLLPIAAFGALVVYHAKVRQSLARAQRAAAFYRSGLARIEDRWTGTGQHGDRFADAHHVYAADLDLFGAGGLFELLCTARTRMGEATLARWLLAPASVSEVKARQEAVTELRAQLDLREDLAILGETATVGVHPDALLAWVNAPHRLQQRWIKWLAPMLALLAVVAAVVWYMTGIAAPFLVTLTLQAGALYRIKQQLSETIHAAESTFANLDLLSSCLARLESTTFHAPRLAVLKQALHSHGLAASRAVAQLRAIVQRIESRRNIFVAVLDVPLMITVRAAMSAEAWRRDHGHAVEAWLNVVGEVEALLCIAAYSYEHPADPFPEFIDGAAAFSAHQITHPLIPATKAVRNDVAISAATRVLLVSGSNMSGKSTLLRTVGINTVLAMMGAPVRAEKVTMTALQVGASIRVNDSLQEGSSRFYAEITRLRQIHETTGKTPALLMLLDELLQGTNSADRLVGAQGIVKALIDRGAIGLVSTHDLALTAIGGADDNRIVNVHFQDEIVDGNMRFDFTLQSGVVTKSNALELMRSIGLKV